MSTLRVAVAALLITLSTFLTACVDVDSNHNGFRGRTDTEPAPTIKHEVSPLAAIYPAIGQPISVAWVQMPKCDGPQPPQANGQCGEVIYAVVRLTPEKTHALRYDYITNFDDVQNIDFTPEQELGLFPGAGILNPYVPAGRYQTAEALSGPFTSPTHGVTAYLHESLPVLVLDGSST